MVNLRVPSLDKVEKLAKNCFRVIDLDYNYKIEEEEFIHWLHNNWDIQDFLLKYA